MLLRLWKSTPTYGGRIPAGTRTAALRPGTDEVAGFWCF